MRNLEIDSSTTLAHILNELKTTEDDGLELTVVPGSKSILESDLDRAIIEKVAKKFNKELVLPEAPIETAPVAADDNLGFVEGEDIVSRTPMQEVQGMIKTAEPVAKTQNPKRKFALPLKFPRNKWAFILAFIVIAVVGLVTSVVLLPTAEVTLTLAGESKDAQATITASPTTKEVNIGEAKIPLKTDTISKDGSDEMGTTGKKTIGTYATGRVTIYNQDTDQGKSFVAGTILKPVATSSATFKLNSDISVDKAPPGGKSSAGQNVTATKVGADSNLAAGTVFQVGSSSLTFVYAQNDTAFSGGSTKEAQVASQADRDLLKGKIIDSLSKDAEKELANRNKGSIIPDGALESSVVSETYDPKTVDAEADKLKATIKAQFKASLVNVDDVKKVIIGLLEKSDPNNKVSSDNLDVSLQQLEKANDGTLRILVKYKALLVPELNKDDIARQLQGKTLSQTGNYLSGISKVAGYRVTISPSIFRFVGFMPFSKDRIKVNFKTQ